MTLFLESGFDTVTLDDVVARAGGSKATVYSYFGAKDSLFHSCVEHLCGKILQSVSSFKVDELPVEEALHQIGVSFLNAVLSDEALALHRLVVAEGKRFPEIANRFYSADLLGYIAMSREFSGNVKECRAGASR